MPDPFASIPHQTILDHTGDGIYVVDLDCRILYWNRPAEEITGWKAEDVLGRRCRDDILIHVDRAGERLCEPGRCPLHRAMATDQTTRTPVVVYAQTKSGGRVPVAVSVAPLRDELGNIIGGVEVFRDETENEVYREKARLVQQHALAGDLPQGALDFEVLYRPHDVVGGDYYRVQTLADGRHAFMMADVAGHGVAAALYTMTLHALWHEHAQALADPALFLSRLNASLDPLTVGDSFTTAFVGLIDPVSGRLDYASAGHPPALLRRAAGRVEVLDPLDLAVGMLPEGEFRVASVELEPGGMLLLCSDGALEAKTPLGEEFGLERLSALAAQADPAQVRKLLGEVELALLRHAESIHLEDDLTILAVTRPNKPSVC
jgi:PAS domain S-box-containing protein